MRIIEGLSEIYESYDAYILDLYGVLHDGLRPYPGTIDVLNRLQENKKKVCLLSNTPRRIVDTISQCEEMGIARNLYDEVVTSGEATYEAFVQYVEEYGSHCWFIGPERISRSWQETDFTLVDRPDEADFILNAIPGTEQSEVDLLLKNFDIAIPKKLPMICANPDMVVNIGAHQYQCAGTFAKIYEEKGGQVIYFGKPHIPVYEAAFKKLGSPDKARICAVGDSLYTDIQGANRFDIDCIFNLVGIHWEEVQLDHEPGKADSEKVISMINAQSHQPTYVMGGFQW